MDFSDIEKEAAKVTQRIAAVKPNDRNSSDSPCVATDTAGEVDLSLGLLDTSQLCVDSPADSTYVPPSLLGFRQRQQTSHHNNKDMSAIAEEEVAAIHSEPSVSVRYGDRIGIPANKVHVVGSGRDRDCVRQTVGLAYSGMPLTAQLPLFGGKWSHSPTKQGTPEVTKPDAIEDNPEALCLKLKFSSTPSPPLPSVGTPASKLPSAIPGLRKQSARHLLSAGSKDGLPKLACVDGTVPDNLVLETPEHQCTTRASGSLTRTIDQPRSLGVTQTLGACDPDGVQLVTGTFEDTSANSTQTMDQGDVLNTTRTVFDSEELNRTRPVEGSILPALCLEATFDASMDTSGASLSNPTEIAWVKPAGGLTTITSEDPHGLGESLVGDETSFVSALTAIEEEDGEELEEEGDTEFQMDGSRILYSSPFASENLPSSAIVTSHCTDNITAMNLQSFSPILTDCGATGQTVPGTYDLGQKTVRRRPETVTKLPVSSEEWMTGEQAVGVQPLGTHNSTFEAVKDNNDLTTCQSEASVELNTTFDHRLEGEIALASNTKDSTLIVSGNSALAEPDDTRPEVDDAELLKLDSVMPQDLPLSSNLSPTPNGNVAVKSSKPSAAVISKPSSIIAPKASGIAPPRTKGISTFRSSLSAPKCSGLSAPKCSGLSAPKYSGSSSSAGAASGKVSSLKPAQQSVSVLASPGSRPVSNDNRSDVLPVPNETCGEIEGSSSKRETTVPVKQLLAESKLTQMTGLTRKATSGAPSKVSAISAPKSSISRLGNSLTSKTGSSAPGKLSVITLPKSGIRGPKIGSTGSQACIKQVAKDGSINKITDDQIVEGLTKKGANINSGVGFKRPRQSVLPPALVQTKKARNGELKGLSSTDKRRSSVVKQQGPAEHRQPAATQGEPPKVSGSKESKVSAGLAASRRLSSVTNNRRKSIVKTRWEIELDEREKVLMEREKAVTKRERTVRRQSLAIDKLRDGQPISTKETDGSSGKIEGPLAHGQLMDDGKPSARANQTSEVRASTRKRLEEISTNSGAPASGLRKPTAAGSSFGLKPAKGGKSDSGIPLVKGGEKRVTRISRLAQPTARSAK